MDIRAISLAWFYQKSFIFIFTSHASCDFVIFNERHEKLLKGNFLVWNKRRKELKLTLRWRYQRIKRASERKLCRTHVIVGQVESFSSLFFLFLFPSPPLVMESRYKVASFKFPSFFFFFSLPSKDCTDKSCSFSRTLVDLYATPRERGLWIWFINIFRSGRPAYRSRRGAWCKFLHSVCIRVRWNVTRKMWFFF